MKSTKVQTLGAYCMSCSSPAYYANARARKLATPRVVAVTRGAVSSLSTRASGISSKVQNPRRINILPMLMRMRENWPRLAVLAVNTWCSAVSSRSNTG